MPGSDCVLTYVQRAKVFGVWTCEAENKQRLLQTSFSGKENECEGLLDELNVNSAAKDVVFCRV